MLSIGDFARYAGVSVRMLRHYDQLGLVVPASVDPVSGYRYYTAAQFPRVNRLVALKDLGFSLDQVGRILDGGLGADELRGMLRLREAELVAQVEADQHRLESVAARLRTIESEGKMSEKEYVEKPLPAVRLAQLTTTAASYEEIGPAVGPLFDGVRERLAAAGAPMSEPAVAWYVAVEEGMRIGVGWPTSRESFEDGLEVEDLPAEARSLTVVHHGSMEHIGAAWQALGTEVERRGLEPSAPGREVYHEVAFDNPDAWVTELQQPVR